MVVRRYEYFRVLKTVFNERAQQVSKILFSTRKKIFMSSSIPCMFFSLYGQKLD